MPLVIDLRSAEDTRDCIHRAVQALCEGKLVALPTETVYALVASGLDESAIARLLEVKRRPAGQPRQDRQEVQPPRLRLCRGRQAAYPSLLPETGFDPG